MKIPTQRMFKRGSVKDKTSLYLHQPIKEYIELMAEHMGVTVSDLVADILDDYLTACVDAGLLKAPDVSPVIDKDSVIRLKTDKAEGA